MNSVAYDIVYEISKYLSVTDIRSLYNTSKYLQGLIKILLKKEYMPLKIALIKWHNVSNIDFNYNKTLRHYRKGCKDLFNRDFKDDNVLCSGYFCGKKPYKITIYKIKRRWKVNKKEFMDAYIDFQIDCKHIIKASTTNSKLLTFFYSYTRDSYIYIE